MPGSLSRFLADDHERLDGLLQRAVADAGVINLASYAAFRAGLLTHISLEEKILLPAAQRWHGGVPLPLAATLRLDHGALAALRVPAPDAGDHRRPSDHSSGPQRAGGRPRGGVRVLRVGGWG